MKGIANGVPDLDATGKIPVIQLPDTVLGALQYQGTWNATTNIPVIPTAAAGNEGHYYVVNVAGTTSINGIASWDVGDWIVSNGVVWEKVDNSASVSSVAGLVGAIAGADLKTAMVFVKGDVGLGNVDNTTDASKPVSTATQTALDLKVNLIPNIQTVASASTVTPTFLNDQVNITALAAACQLANPTGTAQDAWGIVVRIKDNGTARALTYGSQYRAVGITLPTTTVLGKTLYLGMIFNNADTKWDVVSKAQEA
jgi:hypothetical protein